MIAIPEIDLRGGCCVVPAQQAAGSDGVRLGDPMTLVREYARLGFSRLHLFDLDAASNRGSNDALVEEVLRDGLVEVQAGGGLQDTEHVVSMLDVGARWAVVWSRERLDVDWLRELSATCPDEIILAVEVKDHRVVTPGWPPRFPHDVVDFVEQIEGLPLAAILLMDLGREGRRDGPDFRMFEDVVELTPLPVYAWGGIGSMAHLRTLEDRGAAAAVVHASLLDGTLSASAVAAEFGR